MFEPGQRITLSYPRCTLIQATPQYARRTILVEHVRDLVTDPLTVREYLRRPLIRRSRFLIRGFDDDRGQARQFYAGTSAEYPSAGWLRMAIYDPESPGRGPVELLHRPVRPVVHERIQLARCLIAIQSHPRCLDVRIFCDDLAVRTA